MNATAIIASLALLGFILLACRTETPAIARFREVGEDEAYAPIEWGPGDGF